MKNFVPQNCVPKLLAGYKRWLSPLLPAACRFTPSCSEYAAEAVLRHGAFRGMLLACWRLLRCHPLGGRGLDPVPEQFCCGRALISKAGAAKTADRKLRREASADPNKSAVDLRGQREAPAHAHR